MELFNLVVASINLLISAYLAVAVYKTKALSNRIKRIHKDLETRFSSVANQRLALDLDTGEFHILEPLKHRLNAGASFGLEYPTIYGKRNGIYMAWDRHTGRIRAFSKSEVKVKRFAEPEGYSREVG